LLFCKTQIFLTQPNNFFLVACPKSWKSSGGKYLYPQLVWFLLKKTLYATSIISMKLVPAIVMLQIIIITRIILPQLVRVRKSIVIFKTKRVVVCFINLSCSDIIQVMQTVLNTSLSGVYRGGYWRILKDIGGSTPPPRNVWLVRALIV